MAIDVHLLPEEVTIAIALETHQLEKLGILLNPDNYTLSSGNMVAAEMAVAKALNLFPKLNMRDTIHLIGRTHARIEIVYNDKEDKFYPVISKKADIYVLVTGTIPDFRVHGYWNSREVAKPTFVVFHHTINQFDPGMAYTELLDDTRDAGDKE